MAATDHEETLRSIRSQQRILQREEAELRDRLRDIEIHQHRLQSQEANLIGGGWGA